MSKQLCQLSMIALGMITSTLSLAGGPDSMSLPVNNVMDSSHFPYSNKFLPPIDDAQYVLAISGGAAWTSAGETQTIYTQSNVYNTYAANNNAHALGFGELFFGEERSLGHYFAHEPGFAVSDSSLDNISGDVWQLGNPTQNNLTYQYNVNQVRLAVVDKILLNTKYLQPYVSGSVGVGFNHAYDYASTPSNATAVAPAPYGSNTTTAFTYTVGAGLQTTFKKHWQTAVGYEFEDWGASSLSAVPNQSVGSSGLNLNHIYSSAIKFTLGYVF